MEKNVGKTTVLNYLLDKFRETKILITSIGRDGEDTDVVTNTVKPKIFVQAGTFFITTEKLLVLCDTTKEIVYTTNINTPLGRVIVVHALSSGFVQLGGPGIVSQLTGLISELKLLYMFEKIITDGAINRKSIASPTLADAVILCTGAALDSTIERIVEKTSLAVKILTLPKAKSYGAIHLPGLVTDKRIEGLEKSIKDKEIVADDTSKIFVSEKMLRRITLNGATLAVQNPVNLAAVTINPISPRGFQFDKDEFLGKMQTAITLPIYNVNEG